MQRQQFPDADSQRNQNAAEIQLFVIDLCPKSVASVLEYINARCKRGEASFETTRMSDDLSRRTPDEAIPMTFHDVIQAVR